MNAEMAMIVWVGSHITSKGMVIRNLGNNESTELLDWWKSSTWTIPVSDTSDQAMIAELKAFSRDCWQAEKGSQVQGWPEDY